MCSRLRISSIAHLLVAALFFAMLGAASSSASTNAGGKVVSAKLSKTSFTAAQARA